MSCLVITKDNNLCIRPLINISQKFTLKLSPNVTVKFASSVPKGCKDYGNAYSLTPFRHWANDSFYISKTHYEQKSLILKLKTENRDKKSKAFPKVDFNHVLILLV